MEKDGEINGDGNSYTTEFRQYDPRIARWTSLDPLTAKYSGDSPYSFTKNMPMLLTDKTGLEGDIDENGNARANLYFVNDGNLSAQDFQQAVANAMADIIAGCQANGIGISQINVTIVSGNLTDQQRGEILDANRLNNIISIQSGGGVSNVVDQKVMTLFQGDANSQYTPFHEFGHLFGLSDRYGEYAQHTTSQITSTSRQTIPLSGGDLSVDQQYNPLSNIMSTMDTYNLTPYQRSIMSDINNSEKDYNHNTLFLISANIMRQRPPITLTINDKRGVIQSVIMNQTQARTEELKFYVKRSGDGWIGEDKNLLHDTGGARTDLIHDNNTAVQWFR